MCMIERGGFEAVEPKEPPATGLVINLTMTDYIDV
jgi:hypothetical protein